MSEIKIRNLTAGEIEVRVQSVTEKGCILLLYKNARCDMKILDEIFSPFGWERSHQEVNGNLFCTVKVFDITTNTWISKQDAGKESNADKEKGHASDAFKRACVNFGIGRELYTAPFIWVQLDKSELNQYNNKWQLNRGVSFSVKEVDYEDKEITKLVIEDNFNKVRYTYPKEVKKTEAKLVDECATKMEQASSMEELQALWVEYRELQTHEVIILVKDRRKKELSAIDNSSTEKRANIIFNDKV